MDFDSFFKERLDALHAEGRYRIFADLERRCGDFPRAFDHRIGAEVTVWCSNDYLGMGQHAAVLAAPATFPAPATRMCCSNASWRHCTERRRRLSSPPGLSPTRRHCRRWPAA